MEYSNRQSPGDPIFWRVCDQTHCHCDFRMTITHCLQSRGLYIINMIDIFWSGLATLIARVVNASILILDIGRNAILRTLLFEIPWQIGLTALSCYFFGVCHTLANSSKNLYASWVGSQSTVDVVGFIVIAFPIITVNPISITAGYYAQIGDIDKAKKWTETIYYLLGSFDFILGSLILISGLRLIRLLKSHVLTQGNLRENIVKIKLGAAKVKIIILIGGLCLWGYCIVKMLYASTRYKIMLDTTYTMVISTIVLFNGPLASCVIEFAIILNVKLLNGFNNLSIGSMDDDHSETTNYTSQQQLQKDSFNTTTTDNDSHRFSLTLSNKLQAGCLWTRQDTLACLQQQQQKEDGDEEKEEKKEKKIDEKDKHKKKKKNKDLSDQHIYNLPSPSSTYLFQQQSLHQQHEEEENEKEKDNDEYFIQLQSMHHHQVNRKNSSGSSIEEEQRHYNAMTCQLRMSSH
ncbi:hypothetical protein BJ944DRAFT_243118 [Cunninghamella echinulata]|nr:hypothetical protein BJ944DRAFT_243118 [Cunninghamella echinulata]